MKNAILAVSAALAFAGTANAAQVVQTFIATSEGGRGLPTTTSPTVFTPELFDQRLGTLQNVRIEVEQDARFEYHLTASRYDYLGLINDDRFAVRGQLTPEDEYFDYAQVGDYHIFDWNGMEQTGTFSFNYVWGSDFPLNFFTLANSQVLTVSFEIYNGAEAFGDARYTFRDTWTARYIYDYAAAVPEPSVWLTLVLGFGVIGGGMRRRSREIATSRPASSSFNPLRVG